MGDGTLPVAQWIDSDMALDSVPNLRWVEMEGDVDFAAGSKGGIQLELKREGLALGVRILNWKGQPIDQLIHSRVRIRGVLGHAYGSVGDLTGHVLWVPEPQQLSLLGTEESRTGDSERVAIAEIEPSNPLMTWGRRVRVRGHIIETTTNGLAVVESGDTYQAFVSEDGTHWMLLAKPIEVSMSNSRLAGLALASHSASRTASAGFDHARGFGTNWVGAYVGKSAKDASFTTDGGILTLRGSGREIGMETDQHYFLWQPLGNQGELSAELIELEQIDSRTQAGLMIRESLDRRSPYVAVLFTPRYGAIFQYRRAFGEVSVGFAPRTEYHSFRWMKLVKGRSRINVEGEVGLEVGTAQEVQAAGKLTWRNRTPVLSEALIQLAVTERSSSLPVVGEPQRFKSISEFVAVVQRSTGLYPRGRLEASSLPGVVTFCGTVLGKKVVFVQGGNADGVEVTWPDSDAAPELEVGHLVEMSGRSVIGKFPVDLELTSLRVTGWGTLPEPTAYSSVLVNGGSGQGRWTEAEGVIRSEDRNGVWSLMTSEGALAVCVGERPGTSAKSYLDALVRLRGVLSVDSAHRARLLVPGAEFIEVEEEAPADPFATPCFSISDLRGLTVKPERLRPMRVGGVVTCVVPKGMYLQDETGGAYVEISGEQTAKTGDLVEVVGLPNRQTPVVLSGGMVRKTGAGSPPAPMLLEGEHNPKTNYEAFLIRGEGVVLEQRKLREAEVLMLQAGPRIIEATLLRTRRSSDRQLAVLEPGSRVAVTGVCRIHSSNAVLESDTAFGQSMTANVHIWLRTAGDIVLLARPPWWTWKKASVVLSICAGALLVTLGWVRMLRLRVAQRTRELKETMGRLNQEAKTSAVLAERNRLASEIHDSLQQGLTAIIMQLDNVKKMWQKPEEARRYLRMARNMAEFSHDEVQDAVWDLRSRLLEHEDLGSALKRLAGELGDGESPQVTVTVGGSAHRFPSSTEHHLLRIGQEAITNAIKHGRAHHIQVMLEYADKGLVLTIKDDGGGFIPEKALNVAREGHFGLQGLRDRAQKIGAELKILSEPGHGASVVIRLSFMNGSWPAVPEAPVGSTAKTVPPLLSR
jgi:signal transduction histidine kinase